MLFSLLKTGSLLVLRYSTENTWAVEKIREDQEVPLKGVFDFLPSDAILASIGMNNLQEGEVDFILGKKGEDGYYKIEGRKLGMKQDLYLHESLEINEKFFHAAYYIPVFPKIGAVITEDIYVGGTNPSSMAKEEFMEMLKNFPTPYELKKYVHARLSSILENRFDSAAGVREKYERYMNKKTVIKTEDITEAFKEDEVAKYEAILEKLERMLENQDKYIEKQWQREILQIILLLYPKYIYAFEEARIYDSYKGKWRRMDFILVDSNGNSDIIEIKKPMFDKVVSPSVYRNNHIPVRDLSGTIMQVEKYIFHLNKSGKAGEDNLTSQYTSKLPAGFKIKITNPCGMVIMGRDDGLSVSQKEDFEVVKRKYKNVVDIITYDDLVRRLKRIVEAWKKK